MPLKRRVNLLASAPQRRPWLHALIVGLGVRPAGARRSAAGRRKRAAPRARGARPGPTHVIGDLHGQLGVLERLLEDAELARGGAWSGGRARLLFLGDLFDRGPDGLGCLELIMRLQQGAVAAGGWVEVLVGNHDLLLLAAHHFGDAPSGGPGGTFQADWRLNGGVEADLVGLTAVQSAWLSTRPALLCAEGTLYLHGDTPLYENLGESVEAVNAAFGTLMAGRDAGLWDALLEAFSEHEAFFGEGGADRARRLLRRFGGDRLVHAHTPISKLTGQADATVSAPLHYADGLCTDIDHGLYRGGPGFVYRP